MAGPADRKGMQSLRFGKKGKPVKVSQKSAAAAKAGKIRLYEDGSYSKLPKAPKKRGPR